MPNGDPRDGCSYPTLTLMVDSYIVLHKHSCWIPKIFFSEATSKLVCQNTINIFNYAVVETQRSYRKYTECVLNLKHHPQNSTLSKIKGIQIKDYFSYKHANVP